MLLLQGDEDRLVAVSSACQAAARTALRARRFPGVGHVPQLEVPARSPGVLDWLGDQGAAARAGGFAGR